MFLNFGLSQNCPCTNHHFANSFLCTNSFILAQESADFKINLTDPPPESYMQMFSITFIAVKIIHGLALHDEKKKEETETCFFFFCFNLYLYVSFSSIDTNQWLTSL